MPVPFADLESAVYLRRQRVRLDLASPRAQSHRSTKLLHAAQLPQFVDHTMRRSRIELTRIRFFQTDHIASKLNASRLHSKANAKIRNLLLTRISARDQHALDAALAESAWHKNSVITFELRLNALLVRAFKALGFNPVQLQLQVVRKRAVNQRLFQ